MCLTRHKLEDENVKYLYSDIENKVYISAKRDEDILLLEKIESVLFSFAKTVKL